MRSTAPLLALTLLGLPAALHAQAGPKDPTQFVPRAQVALGYQFVHTNSPPSGCECFGANGGFASVAVKYKYWLSFAGEFTASHANNISPLGQNLTLTSFTAGPRITLRGTRLVYFGQVLVGGAHGSDSYFPTATSFSTSATSFAVSAGGGVDYSLNHRLAIRPIEVQYLHTTFPNGVNNSENHLLIGAGLVFKFRGHYAHPHVQAPPPSATTITAAAASTSTSAAFRAGRTATTAAAASAARDHAGRLSPAREGRLLRLQQRHAPA